MKEILDFSTSVMWRNLKLIHMWTNFSFLHMFHVQNFEISPHDRFFSTDMIRDIRDKYDVYSQSGSTHHIPKSPSLDQKPHIDKNKDTQNTYRQSYE